MKKKQLLVMINLLKEKINRLEDDLDKLTVRYGKCLSRENAMKRDYIVRTNGIGKMKDKALIADFKKEFGDYNQILNYDLNNLNDYYDNLKLYEQKQVVIDVYGNKKV